MSSPRIAQLAPLPTGPDYRFEPPLAVTELWKLEPGAPVSGAAEVEVLVTHSFAGADRRLIDSFPALRLIANFGVGLDAIDLAAARQTGVRVTYTPGLLTADVADLAMLLILSALRRHVEGDKLARSGRWETARPALGRSPAGKKLGIFGLGRIGSAVADRAAVFGMEIGYCARGAKPVPHLRLPDLVGLAQWADILLLCAPGGAETDRLVDAQVLADLGPSGLLVNVARGSLVDEEALAKALHTGAIAGAALDVFADQPRIPERLRSAPNLTLSPHIGSATVETRRAMADHAFGNAAAFLAGRPLRDEVPL
jgi:lactate dehydrogenase-like 2-hydroxyacid dehydrogenase